LREVIIISLPSF